MDEVGESQPIGESGVELTKYSDEVFLYSGCDQIGMSPQEARELRDALNTWLSEGGHDVEE